MAGDYMIREISKVMIHGVDAKGSELGQKMVACQYVGA